MPRDRDKMQVNLLYSAGVMCLEITHFLIQELNLKRCTRFDRSYLQPDYFNSVLLYITLQATQKQASLLLTSHLGNLKSLHLDNETTLIALMQVAFSHTNMLIRSCWTICPIPTNLYQQIRMPNPFFSTFRDVKALIGFLIGST